MYNAWNVDLPRIVLMQIGWCSECAGNRWSDSGKCICPLSPFSRRAIDRVPPSCWDRFASSSRTSHDCSTERMWVRPLIIVVGGRDCVCRDCWWHCGVSLFFCHRNGTRKTNCLHCTRNQRTIKGMLRERIIERTPVLWGCRGQSKKTPLTFLVRCARPQNVQSAIDWYTRLFEATRMFNNPLIIHRKRKCRRRRRKCSQWWSPPCTIPHSPLMHRWNWLRWGVIWNRFALNGHIGLARFEL